MRLKLILPTVDPTRFPDPDRCPQAGCGGQHFQLHQPVPKPLRDTQLDQTVAHRLRCVRCGHTFRVYPLGVSAAHTSARLRGVAVMLYVLGLSYGAVALVLDALGHPLSKSAVYAAVQAAGERVPGLRRDAVRGPVGQVLVAALGADLTSVKCRGQWLTVGVGVDAVHGLALTVDLLENGEATTLTAWIGELAAVVGATVLVSDDADGFKTAADETGLDQQVCTAHVARNTDAWVDRMTPELARDADGSLAAIGVSPTEAVADLQRLRALIQERQPTPQAHADLRTIHLRYVAAASPREAGTETLSLAYRLRLFSLDRWNLWPLPDLGGASGGGPGWHEQRYRTGHRLVGQGAVPADARVQTTPIGPQRQPLDRLGWQPARWSRRRPGGRHSVRQWGMGACGPSNPAPQYLNSHGFNGQRRR